MDEHTPAKLTEFCPRFHQAIELIGKRWTGAIVRVLICEPHRFNEILAAVPGLSDRLLAERLRELEVENIVERHVDPGPPVRVGYELTASGKELESALRALAEWAEKRTARIKRRKSA
jgi:DNA-binding HxlR family transcriptional regulator